VQDGRGRLGALIGDDLVAGVIEIEAAQRNDRTGGNSGGSRVGDRALARPEAAGGEPPVVGEVDGGADLDVAQEDKRKGVGRAAVVLNDGDVAGGENGGYGRLLPLGSNVSKRLAEIRTDSSRRRRALPGVSWNAVRDGDCVIADMAIEFPRGPTTMRMTWRMAASNSLSRAAMLSHTATA